MAKPNSSIYVSGVTMIYVQQPEPVKPGIGRRRGHVRIIQIKSAGLNLTLLLQAKKVKRLAVLGEMPQPVDWLIPDREDATNPDDEPF